MTATVVSHGIDNDRDKHFVADFAVLAAATVQSAVPGENGPAYFEEDLLNYYEAGINWPNSSRQNRNNT